MASQEASMEMKELEEAYYATLTDREKKVIEIAKSIFLGSFNLSSTNGFKKRKT